MNQNYPNPFNPSTVISFTVPKRSFVELKVYNVLGVEVATLVSDKLDAGKYSEKFDASNLPSGIYLYELRADNYSQSRKMIYLK